MKNTNDPHRHANLVQRLVMAEIVRLHELVYLKQQTRFFAEYFKTKLYLFKKYKIKF